MKKRNDKSTSEKHKDVSAKVTASSRKSLSPRLKSSSKPTLKAQETQKSSSSLSSNLASQITDDSIATDSANVPDSKVQMQKSANNFNSTKETIIKLSPEKSGTHKQKSEGQKQLRRASKEKRQFINRKNWNEFDTMEQLQEAHKIEQNSRKQINQVLSLFELGDDKLLEIKAMLNKEIELGLSDETESSVKCLITYVRELARGDEYGHYLALDLGGTHFRVLLVKLFRNKTIVTQSVHDVPARLRVTKNGHELFDYVAIKLLEFVKKNKLKRRRISLGFTFSFPCKQYGLTQSVLVKWCKGYDIADVVGTDVVKQLKDALKRQLAGLVEAYIDVVAVINDTTGTLVSCANANRNCYIGLIVGTGLNACYLEKLDRCEKWPANYTNPKQVIINCEWGAFGDSEKYRHLDKFRNEFDAQLDSDTINKSRQIYEKMCSGMYIGELLRLVIVKLARRKLLFNGRISKQLETKDSLDGRHVSLIAVDEMNKSTIDTSRVLHEALAIDHFTQADLQTIIAINSAIMHRAAHLVACGISVLLERVQRNYTVIGYDGSVIRHHPYFLDRLRAKCQTLTDSRYKFDFMLSSDGSGIGAAIVAAALHKERRPLYIVQNKKVYELHYQANNTSNDSL
ncbi:Hexokinase type 2, partial [Fragariocoptes setiger]